MQPSVFLKTFWRMDVKTQVFVAMSFAKPYQSRFDAVISPAIRDITIGGKQLVPYRVDISKSGDSILTDIMDGIAHSQMVLADVSSVGKDSITGDSYRNGNVMYEVGLALACRQPTEVLLVRDDKDKFLFDVSTVPHMHIDFTDIKTATIMLRNELIARLKECEYYRDARIQMALSSLGNSELKLLLELSLVPENQARGWDIGGTVLSVYEAAIGRLLDKSIVRAVGRFDKGYPAYQLTALGRQVAIAADSRWPSFKSSRSTTNQSETSDESAGKNEVGVTPPRTDL